MTVRMSSGDRGQAAQRAKVGLIGLGAVMLLIGTASAVFDAVDRQRPVSAIGSAQPATVAAMAGNGSAAASGSEPLAELGLAPTPGASAGNGSQPSAR